MDMLPRKSLNKLVYDITKNNLNRNTVKQILKYYFIQLLTFLEPINNNIGTQVVIIKILYRETPVRDDIHIMEAVF